MSSLYSNRYGIQAPFLSLFLSPKSWLQHGIFFPSIFSWFIKNITKERQEKKKICKLRSRTYGVNQFCFKGGLKSYTSPAQSLWRVIRSVLDMLRQIRVLNTLLQLVNSGGTHIISQLLNYRITQTDNSMSGWRKFPTVTANLMK